MEYKLKLKFISPPTNKHDIVSKQSIVILLYNYTGLWSPILVNQYSFPRSKTSLLYQYVYKVKSSCRWHLTNVRESCHFFKVLKQINLLSVYWNQFIILTKWHFDIIITLKYSVKFNCHVDYRRWKDVINV